MRAGKSSENGLRDLVRAVGDCHGLIRASLVVNRRRCGKPACRCAQGELHESLAFTFKDSGGSVLVHVPKEMQKEARAAADNYRKLKGLVGRISRINLRSFKRRARAVRRAR